MLSPSQRTSVLVPWHEEQRACPCQRVLPQRGTHLPLTAPRPRPCTHPRAPPLPFFPLTPPACSSPPPPPPGRGLPGALESGPS